MHALPPDSRGPLPSAMQLVGKVDDYLDAAGLRPVHISEICAHLNVTRRTLHRAFFDALGLGPITFLRYKRLCAIHSVLRDNDPATTTVAQVAIQHGFIELGRFSHYYHSFFGEYPSRNTWPPRRAGRSEVEITRHRRRTLALMPAEPAADARQCGGSKSEGAGHRQPDRQRLDRMEDVVHDPVLADGAGALHGKQRLYRVSVLISDP